MMVALRRTFVAAECGKSRSNLETLRIVKQASARKMHKFLFNRHGAVQQALYQPTTAPIAQLPTEAST